MDTSAVANSFFDGFNFEAIALFSGNEIAIQPIQYDADLVRQLPFIPGLKEILMLRQIHALEHATVWVLSEWETKCEVTASSKPRQIDHELFGGLSTEQGFYIYGEVSQTKLQRAVAIALERLTKGEWELALHPRCGTNTSVGMLLTALLAMGINLLLPRGPIEQLLGLGVAVTTAAQLAPDLGILAQRYLTTAIPFNVVVTSINRTKDAWGQQAYFVQVLWVD